VAVAPSYTLVQQQQQPPLATKWLAIARLAAVVAACPPVSPGKPSRPRHLQPIELIGEAVPLRSSPCIELKSRECCNPKCPHTHTLRTELRPEDVAGEARERGGSPEGAARPRQGQQRRAAGQGME